jgi:hypothetical protein
MTRGVLYMKWGDVDEILGRSTQSLRKYHPELPVHVHECPPGSDLLVKTSMLDITPFDETLFLDIDTVVLGRLDYAFEKAARFGLACCICENPWARRHRGLADRGDMIEYNTGVLFFTRCARRVFDQWKQLAPQVDSTTEYLLYTGQQCVQPLDDQAAFALAVEQSGFSPFVLPLNWNWRPPIQNSFYGPIKIYHGYAPPVPSLEGWNQEQNKPGAMIKFAWLPNETPAAVPVAPR